MTSPNLKVAKKYWSASSSAERKKLGSSSPSWRGLAGAGNHYLFERTSSETRGARAKRLFIESDEDKSTDTLVSKKKFKTDDVDSLELEDGDKKPVALVLPTDKTSTSNKTRRAILELGPLQSVIERNSVCGMCGASVAVEFPTCCIASWV